MKNAVYIQFISLIYEDDCYSGICELYLVVNKPGTHKSTVLNQLINKFA